jgi:molecular chaperone GrpE
MRRRRVNVSDDRLASNVADDEGMAVSDDLPAEPDADATGDTAPPFVEAAPEQRLRPEQELEEQRDKYLRLAAEYDNYRKRAARERAEAGERAQSALTKELLDALDDLARFAHLDPGVTDAATVVEGAEMVERKLHKALSAAGLQVIDPAGEPFDPHRHEAVATERAAAPDEDNTVGRVYQRGYVFKGQLLRPARVVVRQWQG